MHANSPGAVILRLLEMDIEFYQIFGCLFAIVAMRLLRKRQGQSYKGRIPVAEMALINENLRKAILDHVDAPTIQAALAHQDHYKTLEQAADDLIAQGLTDVAEK